MTSNTNNGASNTRGSQYLLSGRYQVIRPIARGGMSTIYLAQDIRLERHVAIKVLFPGLADNPDFVERFRREARAVAKLNHPHIVKVYDSGQDGETNFIVMEYLQGQSLSAILKQERVLKVETAMRIAEDVASALDEAHTHGVIHRDVKPGNIMFISSAGLKVTDFGIARAVSESVSDLTQTGTVMGTATYFSPEQAKGETTDHRSDLYSLGVVMFEMLAGKPPFQGDSPVSVAYQHVETVAPDVAVVASQAIPQQLSEILHRLLAKKPKDRYQSAAALQDDLKTLRKSGMTGALQAGGEVAIGAAAGAGTVVAVAAGTGTVAGTAAAAGTVATAAGAPPNAPPANIPQNIPPSNIPLANLPPNIPPANIPQPNPAERFPNRRPKSETEIILSQQRRRTALFWTSLVLIVAVLGGVVAYIATRGDSNIVEDTSTVEVPSVVRLPEGEATRQLDGLGFVVEYERIENADIPAGEVISQLPRAGRKLDEGETITLTISLGAEAKPVPNVIGMQAVDAQRILEETGFEFLALQVDSDSPRGEVILQTPVGGTQHAPGTQIVLNVSTGTEFATVPDVIGLTSGQAAERISGESLVYQEIQNSSQTVESGFVISTDPEPESRVLKNSVVNVFVSTGTQESFTAPNVIGLTESTAESELRGWETYLTFSKGYRSVLPGEIAGTVLEQIPSPDTTLTEETGFHVHIVIGVENPDLVPVPTTSPDPVLEETAPEGG